MRTLKIWEEIVGVFQDLELSDDKIILHVKFCCFGVYDFYIDNEKKFVEAITQIPRGTKIGIIRTDRDIRVRVVE